MTQELKQPPDSVLGQIDFSRPIPPEKKNNGEVIVVLERHSFTRGCLCSWIQEFCQDFRLSSFAEVSSPQLPLVLQAASLAIISALAGSRDGDELFRQVCGIRTLQPNLPIIAIIDESPASRLAETALRLGLQGYIPTTSTLEIAAAVVHLVAAGGTYIPQLADHSEPVPSKEPHSGVSAAAIGDAKLTPRERKVLDLLAQGMSNKTIAYRLSLSESTVKVHVHRIIAKFNVHNRTEAVVAAYHRHTHLALPTTVTEFDYTRRLGQVAPELASTA